ncbi:hypothetical protein C8Q76DRAFT_798059 [Earliella scabrosa]|nr:hypothetical protein C8Q76DRAFT_798059 [Earliella scabrosa]
MSSAFYLLLLLALGFAGYGFYAVWTYRRTLASSGGRRKAPATRPVHGRGGGEQRVARRKVVVARTVSRTLSDTGNVVDTSVDGQDPSPPVNGSSSRHRSPSQSVPGPSRPRVGTPSATLQSARATSPFTVTVTVALPEASGSGPSKPTTNVLVDPESPPGPSAISATPETSSRTPAATPRPSLDPNVRSAALSTPKVNNADVDFEYGRGERKATPKKKPPVLTVYWYPKVPTDEPILMPPDLTDVPSDLKLAPGDLFYHRTAADQYKLWLWTVVEGNGPFWKPVWYGYLRDDGRRLIVTPVTKQPGWVSKEHYSKLDHAMRSSDGHSMLNV